MAYTYTYVPNGNLESGKPARATDIRSIRDMAPAIAEGADGAPRIQLGALERLTPGDEIRAIRAGEHTGSSATYGVETSFRLMQKGTVRFKFGHRKQSGGGSVGVSSQVFRIRDGVRTALYTVSNTTTSWVDRSVDVSVMPGDVVGVWHMDVGAANTWAVRDVQICTSGETVWPGADSAPERFKFPEI